MAPLGIGVEPRVVTITPSQPQARITLTNDRKTEAAFVIKGKREHKVVAAPRSGSIPANGGRVEVTLHCATMRDTMVGVAISDEDLVMVGVRMHLETSPPPPHEPADSFPSRAVVVSLPFELPADLKPLLKDVDSEDHRKEVVLTFSSAAAAAEMRARFPNTARGYSLELPGGFAKNMARGVGGSASASPTSDAVAPATADARTLTRTLFARHMKALALCVNAERDRLAAGDADAPWWRGAADPALARTPRGDRSGGGSPGALGAALTGLLTPSPKRAEADAGASAALAAAAPEAPNVFRRLAFGTPRTTAPAASPSPAPAASVATRLFGEGAPRTPTPRSTCLDVLADTRDDESIITQRGAAWRVCTPAVAAAAAGKKRNSVGPGPTESAADLARGVAYIVVTSADPDRFVTARGAPEAASPRGQGGAAFVAACEGVLREMRVSLSSIAALPAEVIVCGAGPAGAAAEYIAACIGADVDGNPGTARRPLHPSIRRVHAVSFGARDDRGADPAAYATLGTSVAYRFTDDPRARGGAGHAFTTVTRAGMRGASASSSPAAMPADGTARAVLARPLVATSGVFADSLHPTPHYAAVLEEAEAAALTQLEDPGKTTGPGARTWMQRARDALGVSASTPPLPSSRSSWRAGLHRFVLTIVIGLVAYLVLTYVLNTLGAGATVPGLASLPCVDDGNGTSAACAPLLTATGVGLRVADAVLGCAMWLSVHVLGYLASLALAGVAARFQRAETPPAMPAGEGADVASTTAAADAGAGAGVFTWFASSYADAPATAGATDVDAAAATTADARPYSWFSDAGTIDGASPPAATAGGGEPTTATAADAARESRAAPPPDSTSMFSWLSTAGVEATAPAAAAGGADTAVTPERTWYSWFTPSGSDDGAAAAAPGDTPAGRGPAAAAGGSFAWLYGGGGGASVDVSHTGSADADPPAVLVGGDGGAWSWASVVASASTWVSGGGDGTGGGNTSVESERDQAAAPAAQPASASPPTILETYLPWAFGSGVRDAAAEGGGASCTCPGLPDLISAAVGVEVLNLTASAAVDVCKRAVLDASEAYGAVAP